MGASAGPDHLTPAAFTPLPLRPDVPPRLCVVVDTEETFDWSAPLSRASVDVAAIADVARLQDVLEPLNVTPTYVIDYPVAATTASADTLGAIAARGACHIGAHLHPWVSPPHDESVTPHNSYACNLGADLELQKLSTLKRTIETHVGVTPRSYKAGRYGFGSRTARSLEALGFDVDLSVTPGLDHSSDGGPNFEGFAPGPAWFGDARRLLEVPCTVGFAGAFRTAGVPLHRLASSPALAPLRAVGVLARTGLLNRIMLSPESSSLGEMCAVTHAMYRDGVRVFSLTFHSPSLRPGCTPYVRTAADRDAFLHTIDRYCRYFRDTLGGVASTPADIFDWAAGS